MKFDSTTLNVGDKIERNGVIEEVEEVVAHTSGTDTSVFVNCKGCNTGWWHTRDGQNGEKRCIANIIPKSKPGQFEVGCRYQKVGSVKVYEFMADFTGVMKIIPPLLFMCELSGLPKWFSVTDVFVEYREPMKVSGWVHVYKDNSMGRLFASKQAADEYVPDMKDSRITVYVEGLEGRNP